MSYDEKAFNEQLNENMADDPYGTAVFLITQALCGGATYSGTMSDYEYATLVRVAKQLDSDDPHANVMKAMSDAFGISS